MTGQVPLEEPVGPSASAAAAATLEQEISFGTLHILREAVLAHATAAGMSESRATDVMLTVHELAANAIRHGGGTGQLRIRIAAGTLHCEVSDPGPARPGSQFPAAAGHHPVRWPCQRGHGLWLVRRAADQFTATTGARGSTAAVSFALPAPP